MAAYGMEEFGEAYVWGTKLKRDIEATLWDTNRSRFTMLVKDGGIIAYLMSICPGDHFEIGMLQGGSAILAAEAKRKYRQTGEIYGCDPFGWAPGQTQRGPEPSVETVLSNAALFDVDFMIHPFKHAHPPLPGELQGKRFDTTFIDGNHTEEAARADWLAAKEYTDRYILFHDIQKHDKNHGADVVFKEACEDPEWELFYKRAKMGVVKRVPHK